MRTVLVLGGYGFFGQRISAALASTASVRVIVGGRDLGRASATAHAIGLPLEHAVALDAHDHDLADILRHLHVDVLIHTAGPFQGQDYSVARAAIGAGCDYIDLADGRHFVAGVSSLSALASAAGVTVISGASSVPGPFNGSSSQSREGAVSKSRPVQSHKFRIGVSARRIEWAAAGQRR